MHLEPFRVQSGDYLRQLGRMYLAQRWPWLAVPPLACGVIAAGLADVRWLIVALMVLFIVIPMVLALAYINYALSLEARWSLLEKSITLTDDGLLLRFTDQRMRDRVIRWAEVSCVKVGGEAFLVMLTVRPYTFVMIPFAEVERNNIPIKRFAQALHRTTSTT